jgi:predicted nucleic-acid-binding Zn-ribbon protein
MTCNCHNEATCPKCGGVGFSGPEYRFIMAYMSPKHNTEDLVYTCKRCGYTKSVPTLDKR